MGVPDGGGGGSAPTSAAAAAAAPPPPPPSLAKPLDDVWLAKIEGCAAWLGEVLALCQRVHAQALDEMVVPDVYVQAYAAADPKGRRTPPSWRPPPSTTCRSAARVRPSRPRPNGSRRCRRAAAATLDGAQWAAAQGARHAARLGAAPRRGILRSYALEQERRTMRRIVANAYLVSELRRRRPDAGATDLEICRVRRNGALPLAALEAYSRALCRSCADVQIGARELLKAHARARGAADGSSARRASSAPMMGNGYDDGADSGWRPRTLTPATVAAAAAAAAVEAAAADGAGGGGGGWLTRLRLPRRPRGLRLTPSTRSRRGRAARRARLHSPPLTSGIAHPPRRSRRQGRWRRRRSGCSPPRGWYHGPSSRWAIGWAPARSARSTGRRGGGRRSR